MDLRCATCKTAAHEIRIHICIFIYIYYICEVWWETFPRSRSCVSQFWHISFFLSVSLGRNNWAVGRQSVCWGNWNINTTIEKKMLHIDFCSLHLDYFMPKTSSFFHTAIPLLLYFMCIVFARCYSIYRVFVYVWQQIKRENKWMKEEVDNSIFLKSFVVTSTTTSEKRYNLKAK